MSWREILNPESSDISDKSLQNDHFKDSSSQNNPFCHYCHKDSEIEKKNSIKTSTIAVPDYFDGLDREYFLNLVDFMGSDKHRMDREAAEREARVIVDEYRLRKT